MERKHLTDKETMQALLVGKKLASDDFLMYEFLCLNEEGYLVNDVGDRIEFINIYDKRFYIYDEPKEKEQRFIWGFKKPSGDYILCVTFLSEKAAMSCLGETAFKTDISILVDKE